MKSTTKTTQINNKKIHISKQIRIFYIHKYVHTHPRTFTRQK